MHALHGNEEDTEVVKAQWVLFLPCRMISMQRLSRHSCAVQAGLQLVMFAETWTVLDFAQAACRRVAAGARAPAVAADVAQHVEVLRDHHHLDDVLGVDVRHVAAEVEDAVAQPIHDRLPLPRHALKTQRAWGTHFILTILILRLCTSACRLRCSPHVKDPASTYFYHTSCLS